MISRMLFLFSLTIPLHPVVRAEDRVAIAGKYLSQERNDAIRATAVEYLKDCKKPECRQLLLAALHDSSWVVRYRAIQSLKHSDDLIGLFIELLKDPNDRVWLGAVNSLIKIGDPALDALKVAASDKDPFVREGAIVALSRIGIIVKEKGAVNETGYNPPIGLVSHGSEKKKISKELNTILMRAVHDEDVNVRRDATEAYERLDSPEALDSLLKNTEDPEPDIREAAFWSLRAYSDSRIISSAFQALRDPHSYVREAAAAYLLHDHLPASHTDGLRALLSENNSQIRCLAIGLINRLPNEGLDKRLINELRKHPADLYCMPRYGLVNNPKIINAVFDIANSSSDNKIVSQIAQLMGDRYFISYDPSLAPIFMKALKRSRHAPIRRMSAHVLLKILDDDDDGDTDAKKQVSLSSFYWDKDLVVRSYAASHGAKTHDIRVIATLKQLAKDPDESIRSRAIEDLAEFMPAAFDYLSSLLLQNSEILNADDISNILRALTSSKRNTEATAMIKSAMQSKNPHMIRGALGILYDMDKEAARLQFEKLVKDENIQIRLAAIEGIELKDSEIKKLLLEIIADERLPEEERDKALAKFKYFHEIEENSEIKDTLYSVLIRKNTTNTLQHKIIDALIYSNPEIIGDMIKDTDACELAANISSWDVANYLERHFPEFDINQIPRSCCTGIAKVLNKTTDPFTIEKLQEMGRDNDPAIRAAVATALGEISSSVTLPFLNKLTQDPDPDVREKANASAQKIESNLLRKAN